MRGGSATKQFLNYLLQPVTLYRFRKQQWLGCKINKMKTFKRLWPVAWHLLAFDCFKC